MDQEDHDSEGLLSRRAALLGMCAIGAATLVGATTFTTDDAEAHPHPRRRRRWRRRRRRRYCFSHAHPGRPWWHRHCRWRRRW